MLGTETTIIDNISFLLQPTVLQIFSQVANLGVASAPNGPVPEDELPGRDIVVYFESKIAIPGFVDEGWYTISSDLSEITANLPCDCPPPPSS